MSTSLSEATGKLFALPVVLFLRPEKTIAAFTFSFSDNVNGLAAILGAGAGFEPAYSSL